MSRAPTPMKPATTTPATGNTDNTNAYNMQAYAMMPGVTNGAMESPLSTMQNMYGNMQQQQQQQQQHIHQQQQLQMQQQQMQQQMAPSQPSQMYPQANLHNTAQNVSVVDFKPDVMAQHHVAQMQQKYQQQLQASASVTPTIGLIGRDGQYIPATAATPYTPYNTNGPYANDAMHQPYSNGHTGQSMHPHPPYAAATSQGYQNTSFHRNSLDRARPSGKNSSGSSRRHSDKDSSVIDLVDQRMKFHKNTADAARTATNVADRHLENLVKQQSTAMKSMLDDHTRENKRSVGSAFHEQPKHVQRGIVTNAVENVMKGYSVNKKISPSSYDDDDFHRDRSASSFAGRGHVPSGRYSRSDSY